MDLSQLKDFRIVVVEKKWQEVEDLFNDSLQLQHMQIRISLANPENPTVFIDEVKAIHSGGIGSKAVNGGLIAMVCDLGIGLLGLPFFEHGMTATQHLNLHFLKPLLTTRIKAIARIDKIVGKKILGTIEVFNDKEEVCIYANGIVASGLEPR